MNRKQVRSSEPEDLERNIEEGKGLSDQPVSRAHRLTSSSTAWNNCLCFHDMPSLEANNADGSLWLPQAGEDGDPNCFQPQMDQKDTSKTCMSCSTTMVFSAEGVRFPFYLSSPPAGSLENLGFTPLHPLTFKKGASTAQTIPGCNRVLLPKICPTLIFWVIKILICISSRKLVAEKSKVHHPPNVWKG